MLNNILVFRSITYKTCLIAITISAVLSLIWTLLPLFGWSFYSLKGGKISCSIEWEEHSFNVISYNITIFIFVFILPAIIIFITNLKSVIKV